jgi:phenylacetate-CoA ligase
MNGIFGVDGLYTCGTSCLVWLSGMLHDRRRGTGSRFAMEEPCPGPVVCGRIPACDWPAIPTDAGAQSLALLFQLERSQWFSLPTLQEAQYRQLNRLLGEAMQHIPAWRDRLRAAGLKLGDLVDHAALERIPILTRADVQRLGRSLCHGHLGAAHGGIHEGHTSGSTGVPVRHLQTDVTRLFWRAFTLREHLWQNRDFGGKLAAIRTTVEKGMSHTWGAATDQVFRTGPAVSLNIREDVATQLDWLVAEAPQYLLTHPSNLRAILKLAAARDVRLPSLRQARTFGEMLPVETVQLCERVWNVGVADIYSSEEAGCIAFQCDQGRYHVQAENILLEIVDAAGNRLPPGHVGRVVITVLHNLAMPLIRYEIGDYAALGACCPCGRGLPVLERIVGRTRNMLRLPDGTQHWPSFPEERWVGIAPIQQLQAVQTALGRVVLRVVCSRPMTVAEIDNLKSVFAEMLCFPHDIIVAEVDEIPRSTAGKFEDFVNVMG